MNQLPARAAVRIVFSCMCAVVLLAGCGGGGGGGGGGGAGGGTPPPPPPAAPSGLSYSSPLTATEGPAINALNPTVTGTVTSYSVNPALPAGLTLNTTTGVISGTPTEPTAKATYVVTATNSGGSTTFDLEITVAGVGV